MSQESVRQEYIEAVRVKFGSIVHEPAEQVALFARRMAQRELEHALAEAKDLNHTGLIIAGLVLQRAELGAD